MLLIIKRYLESKALFLLWIDPLFLTCKACGVANTKTTSNPWRLDLEAQKQKFGHTFFTLTRYRAVDFIRSRRVITPHDWQKIVFSSIPIKTSRNPWRLPGFRERFRRTKTEIRSHILHSNKVPRSRLYKEQKSYNAARMTEKCFQQHTY